MDESEITEIASATFRKIVIKFVRIWHAQTISNT